MHRPRKTFTLVRRFCKITWLTHDFFTVAAVIILWHVDPLLGNDREISNYTTAVTRQRLVNSNRGTVFSVPSVLRRYKQDK
jgi:hypothetical protein